MKALTLIGFSLMLAAFIISNEAVAQFWDVEIQITFSSYDDHNAAAGIYDDEIWLFWDREIDSERQIFYMRLDFDGQLITGECQLTYGPGANYAPKVQEGYTLVDSWFPCLLVTWEKSIDFDRDVIFAYYQDSLWSPFFEAFASSADEYNPWPAVGIHEAGAEYVNDILITAQKDSAILVKRYELIDNQLQLAQSEDWPQSVQVSNPTSGFNWSYSYGTSMIILWQVSSEIDTTLYWREYSFQTGWNLPEIVQTGEMMAYNPFYAGTPGGPSANGVYFNHLLNEIVKVGLVYKDTAGGWEYSTPEAFPSFLGNQYDPDVHLQWESEGAFVSDLYGGLDICGGAEWSGEWRISLSDSVDTNPSFTIPRWSEDPEYNCSRWVVFWESNRTGNWDIYGRFSEIFVPVKQRQVLLLPQELPLSVHPIPGNAEFTIRLEIPTAGPAELGIYDLSGRLVEQIYSGDLRPGEHTFFWKARTKTSGVYLLRLAGVGLKQTQKLVLLK